MVFKLEQVVSDGMSNCSVLFVCTGNTCRSTMAHQILSQFIQKAPDGSKLKRVSKIDSCGIRAMIGAAPSSGTQGVLQRNGYPLLEHSARQFE